MFDFQLSYPEQTKEEKGCSHVIMILNGNQKNNLLVIAGKEPDGNSREWHMRREGNERRARSI